MAGSIEKRGKSSYRLIVADGYNFEGKQIRYTKTVHGTKREAEIELAKFVSEIQNGLVIEGKALKFSEFTDIWKRDYASKELAPATVKRYYRMLDTRILPYFGRMYINKIKPTDIMRFYDLLSKDTQLERKKNIKIVKTKKPLSRKTILEHHRLIHAMLTKAVYWQVIVSNPADRVQPPKVIKTKRKCYDDVQCKYLLSNLSQLGEDKIKFKVAIALAIFTGARLGELAGLSWSDIDLNNGIIHINRSSQYISELGVFTKVPKTESSIRDIAIPDFVVSLLSEYRTWYDNQNFVCSDLNSNLECLFVQSNGKPMHPSTISKWFKKFIQDIGLPVINFHGLRHTNASLLISQQIDVAIVAARLGHAQISTTLNFYVHPLLSHNKIAGSALQNLLLPPTNQV